MFYKVVSLYTVWDLIVDTFEAVFDAGALNKLWGEGLNGKPLMMGELLPPPCYLPCPYLTVFVLV